MGVAPHERIDTTLPLLSQFNHMIAAVPTGPDTYVWLDPTASTCSYGDLPYNAQGRTGFLISDTHGEFVMTPIFPAESNRLISATELTLDDEGSVQGTLSLQANGQYALDTRWAYQQIHPTTRKATLATELSQQFPGIQIVWHEISDLSDLNAPITINLGFRVENYGTWVGNDMLLPLPINEFADYAETFANEKRTYSLDFGYPMEIEKTIRIQMPKGWTVTLPKDIDYTTEGAELGRQYRQVENIMTYRLTFTLKDRRLPADAYSAARPLFTSLASEDGSHVLVNTDNGAQMSRR